MAKRVSALRAFVGDLVTGWLLSLVYVSGLTLLFPFLYFIALPGPTSSTLLALAVILILFSFFGFAWNKGRISTALKSLGRITLIPGLIGVFFSILGKEFVIALIQPRVSAAVLDVALLYVNRAVPKVQTLTIAYMILGVLLWFIGNRF